jgi:hypothetical protein
MRLARCLIGSCVVLLGLPAQQIPDRAFCPPPLEARFPAGDGPVVLVDAGHGNLHTADGGYFPFAAVLRKDGFRVGALAGKFTRRALEDAAVLAVVNALDRRNARDWEPPIHQAVPSREIQAVAAWVKKGGSLLLIADHQPFPAAVSAFASAFGFEFHDGWAVRAPAWSVDFGFRRSDGSLAGHAIVRGRQAAESVEEIMTFGGSAFRTPPEAVSLLRFGEGFYSFEPKDVTAFDENTDVHVAIDGWSQGAVREFGRGRVAVFGEAGMFTAQLTGPDKEPFGLNLAEAKDNIKLLLNTVRWLSKNLE